MQYYFFFPLLLLGLVAQARDYYIHPQLGNDENSGTHLLAPFKTLARASALDLRAGDI